MATEKSNLIAVHKPVQLSERVEFAARDAVQHAVDGCGPELSYIGALADLLWQQSGAIENAQQVEAIAYAISTFAQRTEGWLSKCRESGRSDA